MKQLFIRLFEKIGFSILEGNKHSTARLQSYIVLIPILFMSFIFIGFEIAKFIICMKTGATYYISSEIIVIFGMLLSHHLALIFSRKTSQSLTEIKGNEKEIKKDE